MAPVFSRRNSAANASTASRQTTTLIFAQLLFVDGNAYKQVIWLGHVPEKSTKGDPINFDNFLVQ
jgi:hypothetical protein